MPNIVGAAGGLVQSIIGGIQSRKNVKDTNQANRELAEYQYSKDLEMWNRGNEYNAPTMQMERLRDAGLNPNLAYGSGSVAGNTATQLPKYQAPKMDFSGREAPVNVMDTIGAYQDFELKNAQIDQAKANAEIAETEARWRNGLLESKDRTKESNSWVDQLNSNWALSSDLSKEELKAMGIDFANSKGMALRESQLSVGKADAAKREQEALRAAKDNQWYAFKLMSQLGVKSLFGLLDKHSGAMKQGLDKLIKDADKNLQGVVDKRKKRFK